MPPFLPASPFRPLIRGFHSTIPAFPRLHGGVAWPADAWKPKAPVKGDAEGFFKTSLLELPSDLAVPRLPAVPCPSNAPLLARATISSFIPSHTKFYSFFASHAACALQLPARAASLDPLLRRYRINRSPFAQAKRKDVFERKIHRNVIEIRGEKARAADAWEWWLRRNAPPGVVIEVERWSAESFGFGSRMREFEKRWRGDNEALLREAKEKGETVRTIDGYLAKPKDPASVVMNKVEEILGKWKQADQAAKKKRSKK